MKIKAFVYAPQPKPQEIELELDFPFYRKIEHDWTNTVDYTRFVYVNERRIQLVTISETKAGIDDNGSRYNDEYKVEVEYTHRLGGGDIDYASGRGDHACTREEFEQARQRMLDFIHAHS